MPARCTYNFGGAAAGIDYRLDPRFLVGIGVGYTHGTQWVNSFMGQGWTDCGERRRLRSASRKAASTSMRWRATPSWMHEFADVARPITAAFAGAPGNCFTVFGATPLRNAAVVGLQATTNIAAATQIYLRYDGEIATGTDNHALNVGVRMSW